jgi:hypothetical protein
VFCYTSWRFYAFSRTNLLTRCHSASCLFSAIFVFQKIYTGNIFGIGQNKSQSSYFSRSITESKAETERSQRMATPPHDTGHPLAAPRPGVGPLPTFWCHPSAYIFPSTGKPRRPNQFSSKHTASRHRHWRKIGRVHKLFSAPYRRGESPPEAFFITMPASRVMYE